MRNVRLCRFGLLLVLGAAACAVNPATGERQFSLMSEQQEIAVGQDMDVEVQRQMGLYDDRALQDYVSGLGLRMAKLSERPNLPWHFAVVDSPAVNAFALPGGYIYLTRGIMPFLGDEAEIVGVLGHEIGHVTARHSAQQYSRATGAQLGLILGGIFVPATRPFGQLAESSLGLLFLKYGRDDELQADALGARYAGRGGWDPDGVAGMLNTLDRLDDLSPDRNGVPNWLASHPPPADRVERVRESVARARTESPNAQARDRAGYLKRLDGLIYGDNPDQGIVRGRRFLHRSLRFGLEFPGGWTVTNSPTQVVAQAPKQNVFVLLQIVERPAGRNIEETAQRAMQDAGFRLASGGRTTVNGLDAFLGTYEGTLEGLGAVFVRAAHIVHGSRVFMVAGLAPTADFRRAESVLNTCVRSFVPLSAAEAEAIRPNRIDIYTARNGDTWQALAERTGGVVNAGTLAAMNGRSLSEQPRAGDMLKIVVVG